MGYNLLINGVYLGYNYPLTNLLLTSWDIQVVMNLIQMPIFFGGGVRRQKGERRKEKVEVLGKKQQIYTPAAQGPLNR